MLFRLYGPKEGWLQSGWKLGDIETGTGGPAASSLNFQRLALSSLKCCYRFYFNKKLGVNQPIYNK